MGCGYGGRVGFVGSKCHQEGPEGVHFTANLLYMVFFDWKLTNFAAAKR